MIDKELMPVIAGYIWSHSVYIAAAVVGLYYTYWLLHVCKSYVNDKPADLIDGSLVVTFVVCPLMTFVILMVIAGVVALVVGVFQWLALYITGAIFTLWGILYAIRGVVRLNKKLDKHTSDKNAHK